MSQWKMAMPMTVGSQNRSGLCMGVLMMGTVGVRVFMIYLGVRMIMLVPLGQVQPDAQGHEDRRGQKAKGDLFPEEDDTRQAPQKGGQ